MLRSLLKCKAVTDDPRSERRLDSGTGIKDKVTRHEGPRPATAFADRHTQARHTARRNCTGGRIERELLRRVGIVTIPQAEISAGTLGENRDAFLGKRHRLDRARFRIMGELHITALRLAGMRVQGFCITTPNGVDAPAKPIHLVKIVFQMDNGRRRPNVCLTGQCGLSERANQHCCWHQKWDFHVFRLPPVSRSQFATIHRPPPLPGLRPPRSMGPKASLMSQWWPPKGRTPRRETQSGASLRACSDSVFASVPDETFMDGFSVGTCEKIICHGLSKARFGLRALIGSTASVRRARAPIDNATTRQAIFVSALHWVR